jgi:hypothetical protein
MASLRFDGGILWVNSGRPQRFFTPGFSLLPGISHCRGIEPSRNEYALNQELRKVCLRLVNSCKL